MVAGPRDALGGGMFPQSLPPARAPAPSHAFIRQALVWLDSAVEDDAKLQVLGDFREILVEHFAAEERAGGFFDTVSRAAPSRMPMVAKLSREHGELLAEIDRIRAVVAQPIRPSVQALRADLRDLIRRLRRHEAAEEALLVGTWIDDAGCGD
jgi:hypothetical protein